MSFQYLTSAVRQFTTYKQLAEKAMLQINDDDLNWQTNEDSNSIANIIKHMRGNMLSRWTEFLTTDGEKPDRKRDGEFEHEVLTREQLMRLWEDGWKCTFDTLNSLTDDDLQKTIYI